MAQLRRQHSDFQRRDAEIVAVCPEGADQVARFWEEQELPFVGVSDPDHEVARRFGQEVKLLRLGRMPALLIVDRDGRIRYRHYSRSMSDTPRNDDVLAALDEIARRRDEVAA